MTPDKIVEILHAHGTQVTFDEAKVILIYLTRAAELEVSEFIKQENEKTFPSYSMQEKSSPINKKDSHAGTPNLIVSLRTVKNNNMKKKPTPATLPPSGSEDKSFIQQAGELLGSIREHVVEAGDSVAGFVSDEVKVVKKAVKKVSKKIARKAPAKKAAPKKSVRKAVKKPVKKASPKKTVKKPAKKAAKKTSKKSSTKRK